MTNRRPSAADVELAGRGSESTGTPTLVDNVETLANVPGIVVNGAPWFRSVGTEQSPGTVICTVSGAASRHGVGEFPMGTPLREVLETLGGVRIEDVVAVLIGVSSPLLDRTQLDTALTYEDFAAAGSNLGTAGFIVLDDEAQLPGAAADAAEFLAVESCGQCTPCKTDGGIIAAGMAALLGAAGSEAEPALDAVREGLTTVADGARCNLASQQQAVVGTILARFPNVFHSPATRPDREWTRIIAPIRDFLDGRFVLDDRQAEKQPDWTFDATDSGKAPADWLHANDAVPGPDPERGPVTVSPHV